MKKQKWYVWSRGLETWELILPPLIFPIKHLHNKKMNGIICSIWRDGLNRFLKDQFEND